MGDSGWVEKNELSRREWRKEEEHSDGSGLNKVDGHCRIYLECSYAQL